MLTLNVFPLGSVSKTEKGFIRQFIVEIPGGKKDVIKVFSKDAEKISMDVPGKLEVKQDFFFAV